MKQLGIGDTLSQKEENAQWPNGTIILERKLVNGSNYYRLQGLDHINPRDKRQIWVNGYQIQRFGTGGYTGEWDSSGRLAMLHQKELVLNAHDTENFLSAIEIVRDLARTIDLRVAAQQSALSAMYSITAPSTTQTLQQDVTIHAEFPNATNRSEIEEAFDSLLNRAAQFANRKN